FDDYPLDVNNSGLMDIDAVAGAADNAWAIATAVYATGPVIGGTISNAGTIDVFASVDGGGFNTVTVGTVEYVVATGRDYAQAVGIHLDGGQNLADITNTGTINVLAVNDGGATVTTATPLAAPVTLVNATGI